MKIISVANQKGGCGKTTTAINLASALGLNDKRVLLIDLDAQAHASLGLDIEGQKSIYNVISKLTPNKLKIENIIKRVENVFDIIPSNILVGTLEQELSDEIGRELKLKEVLSPIKDKYDYILIDCPPSLGILTINAIRVSDEVIIPVETSRFSLQGVDHLMDILSLIKDRLGHEVKCRVLITMFDSRLRHSFAMMETFRKKFAGWLFDTIIHVNVKLKESAVMGKPVAFFDKYCRGSKDYYTLAKEILLLEKQEKEALEKESAPKQNEEEIQLSNVTNKSSDSKKGSRPSFQPFTSRMQEVVDEQTQGLCEARFSVKAPGARSVYVTGSFNDWSLDDTCRLKEGGDGQWEVNIPLRNGSYKYQFIVDGVWKEDPNNPRRERNSFGDINSIIDIGVPSNVN